MVYTLVFFLGALAYALTEYFFFKRVETYIDSQVLKFKAYVESKLK